MVILKKIFNKVFFRPFYRWRLARCGSCFRLGYSSELIKPRFISVGNNFFSGPRCYISTNRYARISIYDDVMFGPEVMILGGNHDFQFLDNHMIHNSKDVPSSEPITIESGVWVGARTIILSKSFLSEGCVVGAGSLVNSYIPPYVIATGFPAKRFRRRFQCSSQLAILLENVGSEYSLDQVLREYEEHGI